MTSSSTSLSSQESISTPKPKRAHARQAETTQSSADISDERIIELLREALLQGEVYEANASDLALRWHPDRLY